MNKIKECASNFQRLCDISYKFIVSFQRKTREINLNFKESDFFHLAGLQYLSDLAIPQNRKKIIYSILGDELTDQILAMSRYYKNTNSHIDVEMRIHELSNLEDYLDTDNLIKIFSVRDDIYLKSKIDAEYIIESQLKNSHTVVYIFLGRRKEEEELNLSL